jgi:CHAT domain-containing protein
VIRSQFRGATAITVMCILSLWKSTSGNHIEVMSQDGEITAIVAKVRNLRRLAQFSDAQAYLRTLPAHILQHRSLAIENCHIFITQGYYNHAVDLLEPLLSREYDPPENEAILVLRLQLAVVKIETEGKFKNAKDLSSKVWELLQAELSDPTEEKVWIAIYYACIVFLQFKYSEATDPILKTSLTERLVSLQIHLQSKGRIDEAFDVLLYCLFALELSDAKSKIEQFCGQEALSQHILGRCHYELGRIQYALGENKNGAAEFMKATHCYTTCSHAIGLADTAVEMTICQEFQDSDSLRSLTDAADIYKHLDYPQGQLRALYYIAEYLHQQGSYTAFYEIQKSASELSEDTGGKLQWCLHQLHTLGYASIQSGHLGAQLEVCKSIVETLHSFEVASLEEKGASQLSFIYLELGDTKVSATYAQKALDSAIKGGAMERASDYAEALAMAKQALAKETSSISSFEEASRLLSEWAEKDDQEGRFSSEFNKYSLLVTLEQKRANLIGEEQAYSNAFLWLEKAKSLVPRLPSESRRLCLAEVLFKEGMAHQVLNHVDYAYESLRQAAELFKKEGKIRQVVDMWISIAQNRLVGVGSNPSTSVNVDLLNDALLYYQKAQAELERSDYKRKLAKCHLQQAIVWDMAYIYGDTDALPEALDHLEQAELVRNEIREEFSATSEAEALTFKQSLVAQGYEIYSLGLELCLKMGDVKSAWRWVQRGKARSLSDLLGLGAVIPAKFLMQADNDPEAKRLLQEEHEILQELAESSPDKRFQLRLTLSRLKENMMKVPVLEPILDLRNGRSVNVETLKTLFGERKNLLCVDWAISNNTIVMFTVRPGDDPVMHKLDIALDYVVKWKRSFFTSESLRDKKAVSWLGRLDKLVSPLALVTKDDDILILSPAGELNALPLHAFCINGKPVIEQHRVVYASSLSVLRHCLIRRSEKASKYPQALVIGDPSSNRQQAALSADRIANRLGATRLIGRNATVSAFRQGAETDIIHYHGHAAYDNVDPLQSALILSDGKLTAREIMSIPLRAALITLVACESAAQDIRVGDEPTGILPSLVIAGANAVVGTLWPLWDTTGGKFADTFYGTVSNKTKTDDVQELALTDLAEAFRESVCQIRKERPEPYFWALFVLHGNWTWGKAA